MKEKITCIYGIKDLRRKNNKIIYVGGTRNYYQRKTQIFTSKLLFISRFINRNGKDNYQMVILKKLSNDLEEPVLKQWVQFYINKHKTIKFGCNMTNAVHSKNNKDNKSDLEIKINEIQKNLRILLKKL